ncbi:MAG: gamma carbonic anhydrase family protein [Bdellovibrionales bacterium]|nr:gamma carbonic anhydrase family protein [Bdellovibrionales bacterium]
MVTLNNGLKPTVGEDVFVATSADIIGDVRIGDRCSIWYQAVIRGDVMPITIGDETNIQDGSVLHGTYNKAELKIGKRVTVGHKVVLHGCEIGDKCLIGMGAIIMDNAKIPAKCIVGAGALVTENSEFEEGQLILGSPARAKRPLTEKELAFLDISADNYLKYKQWYKGV